MLDPVMPQDLAWERDGRDWPNRAASRFVRAAGFGWHVQVLGQGPAALLLHGTGASTHSWRDLAPLLARSMTVIAPDLPGHAFTERPPRRVTLPRMTDHVAALLAVLGVQPRISVGHSAGAAIAIELALQHRTRPAAIVSLNGALLPFGGLAGEIFSPLAKLLAVNPLVPWLFARRAEKAGIGRLISETGSRLDPAGAALYLRLAQSSQHVRAALAMMAGWDLKALARALPRLTVPLVLVTGTGDRAIPPDQADAAHALLPSAEVVKLPGLGHLAHEEQPAVVADLILAAARRHGVLPQA